MFTWPPPWSLVLLSQNIMIPHRSEQIFCSIFFEE
jgi:hypothetical protein